MGVFAPFFPVEPEGQCDDSDGTATVRGVAAVPVVALSADLLPWLLAGIQEGTFPREGSRYHLPAAEVSAGRLRIGEPRLGRALGCGGGGG